MALIGKYIYGVIPRPCSGEIDYNIEELFGPFGIIASEEVYTISYQDISAVVSSSEIFDYSHMLKDALVGRLIRHQKVIEGIMSEYTVIPMKLGTFAVDEDEVRYILAAGYPIIKEIFNKTFDKIEIDLVATWSDFNSIIKEIGEEKEIKEFKGKLLANPKGITVDDRMQVGVMIKKALDEKKEKYASEIQDILKSVSRDFKIHNIMDDKMIVNIASLISRARRDDFDRKVEELNTKFEENLNFRSVGPLPPYSFYTLEIKRLRFEEVDGARRILGLKAPVATKEEIKKAHQQKSLLAHPDRNPDTPGIEREFDEVTRAYNILLEYCRDGRCFFKKEDFINNSLIVRLRENMTY